MLPKLLMNDTNCHIFMICTSKANNSSIYWQQVERCSLKICKSRVYLRIKCARVCNRRRSRVTPVTALSFRRRSSDRVCRFTAQLFFLHSVQMHVRERVIGRTKLDENTQIKAREKTKINRGVGIYIQRSDEEKRK